MRYSAEEKAMWLEDWKQSGKSAWKYAKVNGLNTQTFINWTKPKKQAEQSLIEIPAKMLQTTRLMRELIIEKEGIKIYIPLAVCVEELSVIFKALGTVQ